MQNLFRRKKNPQDSRFQIPDYPRQGFTLVELLVAMTLFALAVSVAAGGFVRALRTQRQLVALIAANSNASLAIEQMAREIRTGFDFACVGGLNPCEELKFTNAAGEEITYRNSEGTLERGSGSNFQKMTADNVFIRHISFQMLEMVSYPPRLTITIGVTGRGRDVSTTVTTLQTTVSSRMF